MNEERTATRAPALGRWILVAALIAAGLALYFWYAPASQPPVPVTGTVVR